MSTENDVTLEWWQPAVVEYRYKARHRETGRVAWFASLEDARTWVPA